jgi:hypothetical protein
LLLLPAAAPVSRLYLLVRLLTEPVDDKANISTDAELASSVDSVLRAAEPRAVVPLAVLNLRRILAGLLLLATDGTAATAGTEAAQLPAGSRPLLL